MKSKVFAGTPECVEKKLNEFLSSNSGKIQIKFVTQSSNSNSQYSALVITIIFE